jgi:hypothetical protein
MTLPTLVRPNACRHSEFILDLVYNLIHSVFSDSGINFAFRDLIRPTVGTLEGGDRSTLWQRIADQYYTADGYLRAGQTRKPTEATGKAKRKKEKMSRFKRKIHEARLGIRHLVYELASCLEYVPIEVKRMQYWVMLVRFWNICHKLLKKDMEWAKYDYSYVADFLLEFAELILNACGNDPNTHSITQESWDRLDLDFKVEIITSSHARGPYCYTKYRDKTFRDKERRVAFRKARQPCKDPQKCGREHPLYKLLCALGHVPKGDMQEILRLGATRTVETMAPRSDARERNMVLHVWTDFMYYRSSNTTSI